MDGKGNKASVVSLKKKPRSSYKPQQCRFVGFVWFKDYGLPRVQKNLLLPGEPRAINKSKHRRELHQGKEESQLGVLEYMFN